MRYLRCPDCAELVDASLDVCPLCNALMRLPRTAPKGAAPDAREADELGVGDPPPGAPVPEID